MTRRQLQPYKPELRTALDRMTRLIEKRTAEVAALRAELRRRRWDGLLGAISGVLATLFASWISQ